MSIELLIGSINVYLSDISDI